MGVDSQEKELQVLREQNKILKKHYTEVNDEIRVLHNELKYSQDSFKQYKQMVTTIFQNKFDESKKEAIWMMNNMAFLEFAHSLGIDLK